MNYEYKEKEKKNGVCVSIRDKGENSLLEVEIIGNNVKMVTYIRNDYTAHFEMPLELFEQMYKKLMENHING
ncbi:hypothetical protein ACFSFY_12830 [Sporosarcina siberiensis]|uniref:Uncharacterized protein n=1 Tax=Sporosarcina siberiensis TaxID=1365606 RepID=A0ABW4SKG4_9BACL